MVGLEPWSKQRQEFKKEATDAYLEQYLTYFRGDRVVKCAGGFDGSEYIGQGLEPPPSTLRRVCGGLQQWLEVSSTATSTVLQLFTVSPKRKRDRNPIAVVQTKGRRPSTISPSKQRTRPADNACTRWLSSGPV